MFRSDALSHEKAASYKSTEENVNILNIDIVSEIEKELQDSPYDVISLVFLLYDVPDTALQRLIVYQRVLGDVSCTNLNLLREWVQGAKLKSSWKHEFIEALLICQLYGIVNKLGFHIPSLKKHYQPDNLHVKMYINPMKKALYKVCESIDSENLDKLKRTLRNCKMDIMDFDSCELILLKLMSEKFITITQIQYDRKVFGYEFKVDKLIKILEKLPNLEQLVKELKGLQNRNSGEPASAPELPIAASTPFFTPSDRETTETLTDKQQNQMTHHDFADVFEMMGDLNLDDENNLKSDTKTLKQSIDKYPIKNFKRIGICIIINQEEFCLSEKSLNDVSLPMIMSKRKGSTADKLLLQKTMTALNFEVIIGENLNYNDMIDFIKNIIRERVEASDSTFMLCLLSHGVRGHVYAADCIKVNVEDIQGILDSDEATILRGIPKVLIIEACQIDDPPPSTLVADSPFGNRRRKTEQYYVKKSDFLVYWATAPQFEAFRDERVGSIFIQLLCRAIQKRGRREHLYDIFTLVNYGVKLLCEEKKIQQMPLFESTLSKKLYLYNPN